MFFFSFCWLFFSVYLKLDHWKYYLFPYRFCFFFSPSWYLLYMLCSFVVFFFNLIVFGLSNSSLCNVVCVSTQFNAAIFSVSMSHFGTVHLLRTVFSSFNTLSSIQCECSIVRVDDWLIDKITWIMYNEAKNTNIFQCFPIANASSKRSYWICGILTVDISYLVKC